MGEWNGTSVPCSLVLLADLARMSFLSVCVRATACICVVEKLLMMQLVWWFQKMSGCEIQHLWEIVVDIFRTNVGFTQFQGRLTPPPNTLFLQRVSSGFHFGFSKTPNPISFSGRSEGISFKLLGLSFWRDAAVSSHSGVTPEYCARAIVSMSRRSATGAQPVWPAALTRGGVQRWKASLHHC